MEAETMFLITVFTLVGVPIAGFLLLLACFIVAGIWNWFWRKVQWRTCCQYQKRQTYRDTWTQECQGRKCLKCGTFHPCRERDLIP